MNNVFISHYGEDEPQLDRLKERFYWMMEKNYIFDFFKNVDKDGLFAF